MHVAVIIPLFNGADWIRETLESALAQRGVDLEIVVVDDGSTDGSRDIVENYRDVTIIGAPASGAAGARNFGAAQTGAPLLTFLDQDDLWHPDHLRHLGTLLGHHTAATAAVATTLTLGPSGRFTSRPLALRPQQLDPWWSFPINPVAVPSAVLVRRDAFEACGRWSAQFPLTGDHLLWLRLSVAGGLVQNRCASVIRRLHPLSYSAAARSRPGDYLAETMRCAESALEYRIQLKPSEAHVLHRRLHVLGAAGDVASAVTTADDEAFTRSAMLFEATVAHDCERFVELACGFLLWLLEPLLSAPAGAAVAQNLMVRWPAAAPRTGAAIRHVARRVIPWRMFLRLCRAQPADLERWLLLADVLRRRMVRRLAHFSVCRQAMHVIRESPFPP